MDRYDPKTDKLGPSLSVFERPPPFKTRITLQILELLHLVRLERVDFKHNRPMTRTVSNGQSSPEDKRSRQDRGRVVSTTNLTILNFLLVLFGPMHERTLCAVMGGLQVSCSILAFGVRYGAASWVYGGDRR